MSNNREENPTKGELIWRIVAIVIGVLFLFAFPTWLDIQSAGGWNVYMNDSDRWLAGVLLFISRFAR